MPVTVKADISGLKAFSTRLKAIDGLKVRAGVLKKDGLQPAKFNQGTGAVQLSLAALAAIQEYGSPRFASAKHIPARPAMRRAASDQRRISRAFVTSVSNYLGAEKLSMTTMSAGAATKPAGADIVRQIEESYETTRQWARDNAPSTVAKKGFDFPLTETGRLKRSMTYEIINRRGTVVARGNGAG